MKIGDNLSNHEPNERYTSSRRKLHNFYRNRYNNQSNNDCRLWYHLPSGVARQHCRHLPCFQAALDAFTHKHAPCEHVRG
ncbi:hypothetical protein ACROYT_G035849 [Oculina patagonica]